MSKPWRIDPRGCGCTGCILGDSKPIDRCSQQELAMAAGGILHNASGEEIEVVFSARYGNGDNKR